MERPADPRKGVKTFVFIPPHGLRRSQLVLHELAEKQPVQAPDRWKPYRFTSAPSKRLPPRGHGLYTSGLSAIVVDR
jgi:hypothetical protein